MKKVFAAIIVFALSAVILCACGESGNPKSESQSNETSTTENATEEETKTTKPESSAASNASAADLGDYEGSWKCVIDASAMGYDKITLELSKGSFEMTMTKDDLEEVSVGSCEEGENGALVCYCTKITTRNTAENTVEDEMVISESEREDAKMTVEMLENGHISATNYSGTSIEFEKE